MLAVPSFSVQERVVRDGHTEVTMKRTLLALAGVLIVVALWQSQAHAAVKTRNIEYKQGDTTLQGFLAYDDAVKGRRPAHGMPGVAS